MFKSSEQFGEVIKRLSRRFKAKILYDNNEIDEGISSAIVESGSCGADSFTVGCVFSSYATITLKDPTVQLAGKEIELHVGLYLDDESIEYVKMGYFTVSPSDINKSKDQIVFVAKDRISSRCGAIYIPTVTFPATIGEVLTDIEQQAEITIETSLDTTKTLSRALIGIPCREVLGYIACCLGGFCYADRNGIIRIAGFPAEVTKTVEADQCVSDIQASENDYTIQSFTAIISDTTYDDDGNEIPGTCFTEGTGDGITVNNPYMTEELFDLAKTKIVGYSYRPGTAVFLGDPRLDPEDVVSVTDGSGNTYSIPCMSISQDYDGGLTTTITAPGQMISDDSVQGPLSVQVERLKAEMVLRVREGDLISSINMSPEKIKISSGKIELEGIVTANSNFKILEDGSMEAVNGKFAGKVTADSGTIGGWDITSSGITKDSGDNTVYMLPGTNSNKDVWVIRVKDSNGNYTWPFIVRTDGSLIANKATISGNITTKDKLTFLSGKESTSIGYGSYSYSSGEVSTIGRGFMINGDAGFTGQTYYSKTAWFNAGLEVSKESVFSGATVHKWAVANSNSNAGNAHMTTEGYLRLGVASSKRYKHSVTEIKEADLNPEKLLELPVVQYKYNSGYLSEDDARYDKFIPGFIAEDVAKYYPIAADYENGIVNDWNFRMIVPSMLELVQKLWASKENQAESIEDLKQKYNDAMAEIIQLKEQIRQLTAQKEG